MHGKFIRRQICESKSVAQLIERRGPWAGLLFERMILWSDGEGRLMAEPTIIRSNCLPWHERKVTDVQADLEAMSELNLIFLYSAEGTQYCTFPNYEKHQPKQRSDRFIPSEIPPPTDSQSDRQCDSPEVEEEVEGEVEEEVEGDLRRDGVTADPPPTPRPRKKISPTPSPTPLDEALWSKVWAIIGSIPGWPSDETKAKAKAAVLFSEYPDLDQAKVAREMKLWHLRPDRERMKPSIQRWMNFLRIGEERRIREELSAEGAASAGAAIPDPARCTATEARDYLNKMRKDGRIGGLPRDLYDSLTRLAKQAERARW